MTTTAALGGGAAAYRAPCAAWHGSGALEATGSIMPADEGPPAGDERRPLLALAGLGMTNAVCLLGGAGLGWLVDSWLGTTPVFILVGMFSGIVGGVLATYKEVRKYLDD